MKTSQDYPTSVVSKTDVGSDRRIRAAVAKTLVRFPTKRIEGDADLTNEGVRLLKNQARTLSVPTLVRLCHGGGELGAAMWATICQLCGRTDAYSAQHESPELNAAFGALHMLAETKSPAGEFARALIKQMNAAAVPAPEPAPLKPCDVYEENVLDELRARRQRMAEEKRLNLKLLLDERRA